MAILAMVVLEGLSLAAFVWPVLALPALAVAGAATLWLGFRKPEYGIYILLGELFVGSRGHLLEYGPVSIRLVIFAAVFLGWMISELRTTNYELLRNLPRVYWLLLMIIGFGVIRGISEGHGLANVFFDANGYLYLLILPAVLSAVKNRETLDNLFEILAAAIVVIVFKGLLLFLWFTFALPGVATAYHWVIDQDIGEITGEVGSASRIFMQSQFYALMGMFIFAFREKTKWPVVAAAVFSVVLSLSRSFWLGTVAGAAFAGCVALWQGYRGDWVYMGYMAKRGAIIAAIAAASFGLIWGFGRAAGGVSESVQSRGGNPVGEAAGGARLLLLPELLSEIARTPFFGAGFGKTVSYDSYLPSRVSADSPAGQITSYAFEWGYLDTALKIGLLGMVVYLLFIARIFSMGWTAVQSPNSKVQIPNLGMLAGLVALAVLNITTPYLNHPLGIGYLIFVYSYLLVFRKDYEAPR